MDRKNLLYKVKGGELNLRDQQTLANLFYIILYLSFTYDVLYI